MATTERQLVSILPTVAEKTALAILETIYKQARARFQSGKGDEATDYNNMRIAAVNVLRFRKAIEARCKGEPIVKPPTSREIANFMR